MLRRERAHHRARLGARREPHAASAAMAAATMAATAMAAAAMAAAAMAAAAMAAMAAVVLVEGCAVGLFLLLLPAVVRLQDDGERCDQRRQLDWLVIPGGG